MKSDPELSGESGRPGFSRFLSLFYWHCGYRIAMKKTRLIAFLPLVALVVTIVSNLSKAEDSPLRVLLITGGGWHDYKNQAVILKETIESKLNATVDVKWTSTEEYPVEPTDTKIPHIFTEDFSKGYDVVFHNHCHVGFVDDVAIDKAIDNHIQNKAGVILTHGSFHTFRKSPTESWDRLCGCNSFRHVHKSGLDVKIMDKTHPVTKALGLDGWKTKEGELYTTKLNKGTTNLAEGTTYQGKKKTDSCIFSHTLDGSNVVGITLGHHNSTMEQAEYRELIAYSVLWAAKKLDVGRCSGSGLQEKVRNEFEPRPNRPFRRQAEGLFSRR